MKRIYALLALTLTLCAHAQEQKRTEIVAHRGLWKGSAQNSIASLKAAQDFGCWGSEFDLHLTGDNVVVVNHDPIFGETKILTSPLEDLRQYTLKNGEKIPLLDEYLQQGAQSRCVLVLELKPQYRKEREDILMEECLKALRKNNLMEPGRIAFISFSYYICKELARKCPGYTVQYLEGDKSPAEVKADGISGIDYHYSKFKKHPEWVKEAHDLGMSVNVWTVDKADDIRRMIELGVDQITTNDPALAREIIQEKRK